MNLFKQQRTNWFFVFIVVILGMAASGAILGYFKLILQQEENSFFVAKVFEARNKQRELRKQEKGTMILFVGDVMLDRGVEYLMNKNGLSYPLVKISPFLKEFDIVFGNLEGPIVKKPFNFSDASLKFAFPAEVVEGLLLGNFNLLSLANNHTLNMGHSGLEGTRQLLKENNINFVGDAISCSPTLSFLKENIQFLAFNKTFSFNCKNEEIIETIKAVKAQNQSDFLVVSLHWGEEYQLLSSISQQELAHKIVEAGADLIIGHHPHVVQEIEVYKEKLIFYSLGNFIFDQYFSKETQQGLAVGAEVYPHTTGTSRGVGVYPIRDNTSNGEKIIFKLFPIQSHLSQPELMEEKEAEVFLEKLAQKSSKTITAQIKSGTISLNPNIKIQMSPKESLGDPTGQANQIQKNPND